MRFPHVKRLQSIYGAERCKPQFEQRNKWQKWQREAAWKLARWSNIKECEMLIRISLQKKRRK